MKSKKQFKIIAIGLGTTIIASGIVGVSVGISSYNKSYFQKVIEKSNEFKLDTKSVFDNEKVANSLDKVKIVPKFTDFSAKSAFELAKNPLYSFDLAQAFDFSDLEKQGFEVSFDFNSAKVEKNAINNVLVFVTDPKTNATLSKKVNFSGFSPKTESNQLQDFNVDTVKSSLVLKSKLLTSASELKVSLENSYAKFRKSADSAESLERALVENNLNLNLVNAQDLPTYLDNNQIIKPILKDTSLVFKDVDDKKGTLTFSLEIENLVTKTKQSLDLKIQGLNTNEEIFKGLSDEISQKAAKIFKLKKEIQAELINQDQSLAQKIYAKSNTNFDFSKYFDTNNLQEKILFSSADGQTWQLKITPSLKKLDDKEAAELSKNSQVRFSLTISANKIGRTPIKISDFELDFDLQPDLRSLERKIAKAQGSVAKITNFSLNKPESAPTVTATQINLYVKQIFDIIKSNSSSDNSTIAEKVASNAYFLEHGKTGTDEEIKKFKEKLTSEISKDSTVKVESPEEEKDPKKPEEPESAKNGLGVAVVKTLLLAKTDPENIDLKFNLTPLTKAVELNFAIVNKKTNENLADSKIVVNNVFSAKTAFDVAKEFSPLVFIDGKNDVKTESDGQSILTDFSRPELKFKGYIKKENDGYSITKSIKFQEKPAEGSGSAGSAVGGKGENQSNPTDIQHGSFFLAFKINGINDFNKHYLVASKEGKGLFIQKVRNVEAKASFKNDESGKRQEIEAQQISNESPKFAYILGMDFDVNFGELFNNGQGVQVGNGVQRPVTKQQALVLSPEILKEIKANQFPELTRESINDTKITLKNQVMWGREFQQNNNFESDAQFIQDGSTIVLELFIKKENGSGGKLELTGYSSTSQRPKFDKVFSTTSFKKGVGNLKDINTYNLDYYQIGPNPEVVKTSQDSQTDDQGLKPPTYPDSRAKVLIKAFSAIRNSDFGGDEEATKVAREKVLESFVNAYLE
ncbi:Uncharacterised protein [Mesomycoplasma dispar]|uniref:Uncharacterized protein n=1 Tax=Mesomycoplasma dispar TaxID=86660 RepID=A0AAJ5TC21_9BACT|nr:P110/LppT family adhesin N-terminal domain [Mesomycoplasma dispar]AJR12526.1 hypothetical protein MDIS_01350 [Mesomycoplasma dispar]VEU61477.1 Uncharacterised protein [Mesomycoplasma dispar]